MSNNPKLEGLRPPPLPNSMEGVPILPRLGERIMLQGYPLIVTAIDWILFHEVDKSLVVIYLYD